MELFWSSVGAFCVSFIVCLAAYLFHSPRNGSSGTQNQLPLPPQPPSFPLIGHMHLFGKLPHQSLQLLSQKHGPLMLIRLGFLRLLIVSSPDMAQAVLKTHDHQFASRPRTIASSIFTRNGQDIVLSPYGPSWQSLRKICTMELFTSKRIESFTAQREDDLFHLLRSIFQQCESGRAVNVHEELWTLAYDNITKMIMSEKPTGARETEVLKQLLDEAVRLNAEFHVGDYFPSLKWMDLTRLERRSEKTLRGLDAIMDVMIAGRRRSRRGNHGSPAKDLLDVLLSLCEDKPVHNRMNDEKIKGLIVDLFSAGTETTAMTVEWALAELLRHPRVMKRAQEELSSIVGLHRMVRESDIPQLTYLQAIVKEAFRIHPPSPLLVPHFNEEDCTVAGYAVPAKTQVLVNVWAIGRDPQVWERPLEFYPERFLEEEVDVRGQDFKLVPFGSGRRVCVGMALGLRMVEHQLATLIHSFDWKLPRDERAEDMDMSEEFKFSLPKAKHLEAVPSLRLPASLFVQ